MWRQKQSKFKNTTPKIPKKEEWISEVNASNLLNSASSHIKVSAAYMVFNTKSAGGSCLDILPISAKGRQETSNMHLIDAHNDFVSDFDFSPHDDFVLATGSHDCTVKLWRLPSRVTENIFDAVGTVGSVNTHVTNLCWNPLVGGMVAVSAGHYITVHDVQRQSRIYEFRGHSDIVQSFGWKEDGSLLVSSSKDKMIRIIDPRASALAESCEGHYSNRDSRCVWLGTKDTVATTGFDSYRQREVAVRDTRNFSTPLKTISFDTSTGVFFPFFDSDTCMLYAAGKGDTSIRFMETTDKEPFLVLNATDSVEQIKGLARSPKRMLDVMSGEVNRFYILGRSAIIPVSSCVPRKSYLDFHADIFPDTYCGVPTMTCDEWMSGLNTPGETMSLNPKNNPTTLLGSEVSTVPLPSPSSTPGPPVQAPVDPVGSSVTDGPHEPVIAQIKPTPTENTPAPSEVKTDKPHVEGSVMQGYIEPPAKPTPVFIDRTPAKPFSGVRQSKFRHLKGTVLHKDLHFLNLRNVSRSMPGESDMFHANATFIALPLSGPGGLIAVLKISEPGRLPDAGLPVVQNGTHMTDFVFDPFDDHRLVVGCDDARIRVWTIPADGLTETLTEPSFVLTGHEEKIYLVRFHPLAQSILASASYDMSVRIWNVDTQEVVIYLTGHTDTIFSVAWSASGELCATASKDGVLRVYDPRTQQHPVQEGVGPEGARGARLVWTCEDRYIVSTGFNRMSRRCVAVYSVDDLSCLHSVELDASPAILIPHYDNDSHTLFVTSKGDSTVKTFEVSPDPPHLFPLSDYTSTNLHQALAFLPKSEVDVRRVEFAKAYRLTTSLVEPVSFTIPRVKSEFFQDDLFPDTPILWRPTMTADQWLSGLNTQPDLLSLRPPDMDCLSGSSSQPPSAPASRVSSYQQYRTTHKTDDEKKEELLSAMTGVMELRDEPLPQDLVEGASDADWVHCSSLLTSTHLSDADWVHIITTHIHTPQ